MNILPMTLAFLAIFSCITVTFFEEIKSFSLFETAIYGYNRTERALHNTVVRKAYRKATAKPAGQKKSEEKKQEKKDYHSMRSLFPPLENSKFNLSLLIQHEGEVKLHPLYEPLAELLRILYEKNLFSKVKEEEKLEYRLIDELLKKAKKQPEAKHLAELFPQDPGLKAIYYKMIKGTNRYDRKAGLPPLGHFLSLDKAEKAAALSFASPEVLEAFFDPEIATEILALEKKKWEESSVYYYFSKEDFQNILMKFPAKTSLLSSFDSYLDDSKKIPPREGIGGRDSITGISIEMKLK